MNTRGLSRLGVLAVGLGIGAAVASTPGIACADELDFQISIDGYDLIPAADTSALATSGLGDIAIAYGDGSLAAATDGYGDFAEAVGTDSLAVAGQSSSSNFDSAIDIGNDTVSGGALAQYGSGNIALVDADNSNAVTGGSAADAPSNNDIGVIVDPFGSGGDSTFVGLGAGPSDYDLGAILFEDNAKAFSAIDGSYLYDILSPLGPESGAAAATGAGWLADLLSLF
jgi:hypothetical protein